MNFVFYNFKVFFLIIKEAVTLHLYPKLLKPKPYDSRRFRLANTHCRLTLQICLPKGKPNWSQTRHQREERKTKNLQTGTATEWRSRTRGWVTALNYTHPMTNTRLTHTLTHSKPHHMTHGHTVTNVTTGALETPPEATTRWRNQSAERERACTILRTSARRGFSNYY